MKLSFKYDKDKGVAFYPSGFPFPDAYEYHARPIDAVYSCLQDLGLFEGLTDREKGELAEEHYQDCRSAIREFFDSKI